MKINRIKSLLFNDKQIDRNFNRTVLALVIPMALQNLVNVGVTAADVIMLGRLSETAISGASLAGQVQFIITLIFFGLTSGASVLTAQYWGKGDTRTIEKVLGMSLRISVMIGGLFTIVVLAIPDLIMRIFTAETDVIAQGVDYLRIVAFTYIMIAISMVYLNIMRSVERVIISTIVYVVSLFINIILNSILIFGLFGFPAMGVRGAAIATLIARLTELLIVMVYAKKFNHVIRLRFKDFLVKDRILLKDFLTYALPVLLNEMMWGIGTSTYAAIIGHLGQAAVAANSVAQVTRQLATVVTFGLASATSIMVGKAIGEKKEELAKIYAGKFLILSVLLGLGGSAVILIIMPLAKGFMNLSDTANSYLMVMMVVMSYFALCQAFNTTTIVGIFRAGGDTRFGLVLDVCTMWCGSILLGFLAAFVFKLPVPVVYIIMMSDEVLKIPFCIKRYRSYKWLRNVTR